MVGEEHEVADLLADAVVGALVDEEAAQADIRDVGLDRLRVASLARRRQRALVEVGGEDLDGGRHLAALGLLEQQDGEAVGLLAGGAAHRPHPQFVIPPRVAPQLVVFPVGLEQRPEDLARHHVEGAGVAEKGRHRDQQVAEQVLRLLRGLAEVGGIVGEAQHPRHRHAPGDAAQDGRALVGREVVADPGAQEAEDAAEVLVGRVGAEPAQRLLAARHLGDALDHAVDRLDEVGDPGGHRAPRHHPELGLARLLDEDDAARLLDLAHPERPVAAGAAQNHRHPVAAAGGDRAEEHVDRRALPARFAERSRADGVVLDHQLPVGGDDVDAVRLEFRRVHHLAHRHPGAASEDLAELALVLRREVDDNHIGEPQVVADAAEELLQRLDPACRGADGADRDLPDARRLIRCGVHARPFPRPGARGPRPELYAPLTGKRSLLIGRRVRPPGDLRTPPQRRPGTLRRCLPGF